jgi:hypothetical protein
MSGARQLSTAAGLRMRLGGFMVPGRSPYQEVIGCRPRGRRQPRGGRTRAAAPSGRRVHRRQRCRVRPRPLSLADRHYHVVEATPNAGRADKMIRLHPRGLRAIRAGEVRRG